MKRSSLFRRMMVPVIPLVGMGVVVSWVAWKSLSSSTEELKASFNVAVQAQKAIYYASEMSNAMRGYLLDPSNEVEAKRKLEADENLVKVLEGMKISAGASELSRLIEQLEEIDEKRMNPSENRVMELVKSGKLKEAQALYVSEYAPIRKVYDEVAASLVKKANEAAAAGVSTVEKDLKRAHLGIDATLAIGILVTGLLLWLMARALSRGMGTLADRFFHEAEQLKRGSEEALESGNRLTDGVHQQSSAIQETMSAIEEINATLAKTATGAKHLREISQASDQTVSLGEDSVAEMVRSMERIKRNSDETAERITSNNAEIASIQSVIQEIGDKTRVINEIVFQTKLLSFNASVEAARAGEHGKGFAVVAEEVGNLASMSGRAANEIAALLQSSVARVNEIVEKSRAQAEELLARGTKAVEEGNLNAQRCGESFEAIRKDFDQIRGALEEIATATQEQSMGMKEVETAIVQLNDATQAATAVASRSGALAEQLNGQAAQVRALSTELSVTVKGGEMPSAGERQESHEPQQIQAELEVA